MFPSRRLVPYPKGLEVLQAGASCTISVDVLGNLNGDLENTSGELITNVGSSGSASATLTVTAAQVSLTKSFTDDPVPPGDTVSLRFTINNFSRSVDATLVSFTDDLDSVLSGLAPLTPLPLNPCGIGSSLNFNAGSLELTDGILPADTSCTFDVPLTVPTGAAPGIYPNTTSPLEADIGDGEPTFFPPASDNLFVQPVPLLSKEFIVDPVIVGNDTIIRFTIENTSTTSGATNIAFIDELTTFLPFPVSVVFPTTPCGGGSSLALSFIDTGRQGISLTGGDLTAAPGAGSSCTFDVTVSIPISLSAGVYLNTTEAITATVDGMPVTGKPASDSLTVIAAPNLSKSFTNDPVAPGGVATLEFTLTHSANATTDATNITFTDDLAVTLAGLTATLPITPDPPCGAGSTLTGSVGDTLLTLAGGTLSPGQSCTFSLSVDVPAGAASGDHINTTSAVSATVSGQTAMSAPASDDLKVASITFAKEFIDDPVVPGEMATLRFTIENISPNATDDATSIVFTDHLNAALTGLAATGGASVNTCGGTFNGTALLIYTGGSLAIGQMCTIEVEVLVPASAADGNYLNVTSNLTATVDGNAVAINPATDNLIVDSSLLELTKAFTDDPVSPGNNVTLEFTITNLDTANPVSDIAFSDNLDAVLSGLEATAATTNTCGGMATSGFPTNNFDYAGGSLAAGASCSIILTVSVPAAAAANTYTNTTSDVTGIINVFSVSGNAASDTLDVINLLQFSQSFDGPSTATGISTLTFTITNPTANAVGSLSFSDDLNAVIAGLSATNLPLTDVCGTGSQITGTTFLAMTGGNLPANGGTCTFNVDLLVPGSASPGVFLNTTSDLLQSGLKVSIPATANLTIEPPPTFSKVFAPGTVGLNGPNTVSTLTFTVNNTVNSLAATALDFTDNLPAGLEISNPDNASTTCSGGTLTAVTGASVVSYTGGSIGAGTSCTVEIDVISTAAGSFVNTTGDLTSSSGNSGAASASLIADAPPVITPPADIINIEATGPATPVNLGSATVVDATDSGLIASPNNSGPFPPGSTIVTWSVTDSIGNTATTTQTITIIDTTAPVVSIVGANPLTLNTGDTFTDPGATASDLVDGDITSNISVSGTVNPAVPATYVLTYSVIDSAGNTGMNTRSVIVNDGTAPVVTPPVNLSQEATGATTPVSLGSATVTDDVDTGLTASPSTTGPFPVGITTITWTATDAAGNIGSAAQTVTIVDTILPVITVVGTNPLMLNIGDTFTDQGATASDIVDGDITASIIVTNPVNTALPGTYLVNYSVTDKAGNTGSAIRTVLVQAQTLRTFSGPLPSGQIGTLSFSSTDTGCAFSVNPQFINVSAATISPPSTLDFADGLISFEINHCAAGATVNISMDYGRPIASAAGFWKQENPWFQLPATVAGNTISFQITDGGLGDADGVANGAIRDPGGAAINNAGIGPTRPIPTLSEWTMLLLSLFMFSMVMVYQRNTN